jgi:diaminohydroxyphosphoribosylaminopyrimidine deaminase/5-amino-6-(5-phosphoribosylamino)uracil reductase
LRAAGIAVAEGIRAAEARAVMAGFFSRQSRRRPHITLKLGLSLDGCVAMTSGESRWITGERARTHAHLERARADMILVGRGTLTADTPRLDVRLAGLETRAPQIAVMSSDNALPDGVRRIANPEALAAVDDVDLVLAEGGAGLASSLVAADLVDRLLLYRAPILLGGRPALASIGLGSLAEAHGRWTPGPIVALGADRLETYARIR